MELNTYTCDDCGEEFQTTEVLNEEMDDILCADCTEDEEEEESDDDSEVEFDDEEDEELDEDEDEEE